MAFYEYRSTDQCAWDTMRSVDDRDAAIACVHGLPGHRVYSVPTIHWPRSLWTQWSDVFDKSPREMAQDKNVERFDPGFADQSGTPIRPDPVGVQRAWDQALATHGRPDGLD